MRAPLRFALCAAPWLGPLAAHADVPADYAFQWPLAPIAAPLQRVVVPRAVYEGAAWPDLRDLRVFNAAGERVPYAFAPAMARAPAAPDQKTLARFPLRVDAAHPGMDNIALRIRRSTGGTTIEMTTTDGRAVKGTQIAGYVADATGVDAPIAALVVEAAGETDFDVRMRVEASDDLAAWRVLTPNAALVRLSVAGRTLARDRMTFAPVKAKYFRLATADAALPPLTRVTAESGVAPVGVPLAWADVTGAADGAGSGRFVYDAGAAFPTTRVSVLFPAPNTLGPVELAVRVSSKDEWRAAGGGVMYRLGAGEREIRNPPIEVGGATARYWRLAFDPRAGVATAPVLQLGWEPAEIVFAARGDPPFALAYGRRDAEAGALPLSTLMPGPPQGVSLRSLVATTTPVDAPRSGNRAALTSPVELRRFGLWAALVAAVGVLVVLATRMLRSVPPSVPPPP